MNLTILDAYSVNPGDLSWESLEKLGNLTVYERTPSSEVVNRSKDSSIIFTNKTIITAEDISKLPQLKYIGILATGTNVVDLTAARYAGIIVTNIPAYSTQSVAQMTFALLLAVTNNVGYYTKMNREGHWSRSADFCYWTKPIIELAGKTIGIIGLGHIGMEVARIAHAFGLSVLANTSKDQVCLPDFIKKADNLDDLLSNSDVVSLHCPLTDSTRHLINAKTIKKMKSSAILINTCLLDTSDASDEL